MPYVITTDSGDGSCSVHCMVESVEYAKFLVEYIQVSQKAWGYDYLMPDFHRVTCLSHEEALAAIHEDFGVEEE